MSRILNDVKQFKANTRQKAKRQPGLGKHGCREKVKVQGQPIVIQCNLEHIRRALLRTFNVLCMLKFVCQCKPHPRTETTLHRICHLEKLFHNEACSCLLVLHRVLFISAIQVNIYLHSMQRCDYTLVFFKFIYKSLSTTAGLVNHMLSFTICLTRIGEDFHTATLSKPYTIACAQCFTFSFQSKKENMIHAYMGKQRCSLCLIMTIQL